MERMLICDLLSLVSFNKIYIGPDEDPLALPETCFISIEKGWAEKGKCKGEDVSENA